MNINKIGEQILEICRRKGTDTKEDKREIYKLYRKLDELEIEKDEEGIDEILALHHELCTTKGRKASYWEHEIGRLLINRLPYGIVLADEKPNTESYDILKEHYNENEDARLALRLCGKLLKYAKTIIESKPDKSKRYTKRITEALRWIDDLNHHYIIEGVRDIFMDFIQDKDDDVQFFALEGLAHHYGFHDTKKMPKKEVKIFEEIIDNTKSSYNAVAACQVLVNADKYNDWDAMATMDAWKERNWS